MPTGSKNQVSPLPPLSAEHRAAFRRHSIARALHGLTGAAAVTKLRELGPEGLCLGIAADALTTAAALQEHAAAEMARGEHDTAMAISGLIAMMHRDAERYGRIARVAMSLDQPS